MNATKEKVFVLFVGTKKKQTKKKDKKKAGKKKDLTPFLHFFAAPSILRRHTSQY